ncbi:replication initiation protein, partial [Rubrivirga sp.]|uniref:replication initiation protein n=1 Tax=Rubrivirga sp. TaxID=1885344 RepID=UPI003C718625
MSYAEVIKHSATVQVTNTVPLLARRLWNVLLARAYDDLPDWERVRIHRVPVGEVLDALGTTTRNTEHLKDLLKALASTPVEWNVLGKDNVEEWGVSALLAEAKIKSGQVEFSYGPTLRERLHNPRLYVRISLSIQNRFASKHSLALYELCVDYLDVARGRGETPWIPLEKYRAMMGIEDGQYERFAQLNQRVVKASVKEVNKRSDVAVAVEYQKDGRSVTALKFRVRPAARDERPALPA